jgi:hypothetical protein
VATQKQRRRRAKEKRHEYDLVEIDGEGNETVLTASELRAESTSKPGSTGTKTPPKRKTGASASNTKPARGTPQPPSWRRVAKRSALFAPIFLATVLLVSGDRLTFAGAVVNTLFLLAFFVPVSYFMDRFVWRSYEKRQARTR